MQKLLVHLKQWKMKFWWMSLISFFAEMKVLITVVMLLFIGCTEDVVTPKPRGYFRIALPIHQYQSFNPESCPFGFEIPAAAQPLRDTNDVSEPCWWYITFPQLNANIYLTYKKMQGDLNTYTEDAR